MSALAKLVPVNRIKYLTKIRDITIDDLTFRLHYRFTFTFLLIGSLLLTGEQFFGKPIHCIADPKGVPAAVIQSYCWIEGTFTLPKGLMKVIGFEVAAPGIEQYKEFVDEAKTIKDEVITHSYYQWVGVVLFLQAICFYAPHLIWKLWEKGRIGRIINDLNKVILEDEKKSKKRSDLVKFLIAHRGRNTAYAFRYFLCELLNLFNIIIQMIFVNWFLGGEFSTYGLDVWRFLDDDPASREDPMARVFPKMTKCTFRHFGPSGDVIMTDHLCLLPLNILNEKMYIVFWLWMYIVLGFSSFSVLYRIIVLGFPQTRHFLWGKFYRVARLRAVDTITDYCNYGDWFLLNMLSVNLDPLHLREVVEEYADELQKTAPPSVERQDSHPHEKLKDESSV